jgi:hypothetical protein
VQVAHDTLVHPVIRLRGQCSPSNIPRCYITVQTMAAQGILQPPARNEPHTTDASEWEYEYDQNETEDIYFTLDLTTHVPNAIQEKQYAKNGKLIGGANLAANEDAPQGDATLIEADEEAGPSNGHATNTPAITEASTLQILDLHTEKPYVKFNNGFYSCQWFTDLGTQFWITNPGVVHDPKLSGHVLDVVGSSQTRLVAKPANLKRKRDAIEAEPSTEGQTAAQSIEINNDEAASDVSDAESRSNVLDVQHEQDPNKAMVIPRQKIRDPHLAAQASFMERLSELKLKKGEKDAHRIPLKVPVYYKGARNIDALRAAHSVNVDEFPQPTGTPKGDLVSPAPAPEEDAGETGEGAQADEGSPAPPAIPKLLPRKRGRPGGGAISNAARRSNLGLELVNEAPPKPRKKRGRPSNADKVLRAQQAAATAAAAAGPSTFALDPQLGGSTQAGALADDNVNDSDNASISARSRTRSVSAAASSAQGSQSQSQTPAARPPRKGRRTKEQMEEARRLDEERQAKLAAAKLAKAGARRKSDASRADPLAVLGNRSARRTRASNVGGGEGTGRDGEGREGGGVVDPRLEDAK